MSSKKVIDVGVSSALIELKAELLKKKSELGSSGSNRPRFSAVKTTLDKKTSKKYIPGGSNPGLDKRVEKDLKEHALQEKSHEKSKAMLIAKAEIYDNLKTTALDYDEKEHPILASSLVDFQRKALESRKEELKKVNESYTEYNRLDVGSEDYQVNEDEWTEFTDVLGRTRRCLKSDLASFTASNAELSRPNVISPEEEARLKMHEKWENDMEELAEKSEVHYQDIRFDEVRAHGVSYYEFSKDNETREEQIRGLKKMSEQTEADRTKVTNARDAKKRQIKERLKKIRQRKRAKLGLPPEDKSESSDEDDKNIEEEEETPEIVPATKPELPPPMRAWDFGKPGVFGPRPTSFDELDAKWLIDRRADRNSEFAPPSAYSANFVRARDSKPSSSSTSSYSSQNQRSYQPLPSGPPQLPKIIADEYISPCQEQPKRGQGIEIAPPPTFEYYHGGNNRGNTPRNAPRADDASVSDAIAEGLRLIREKAEREAKTMGNANYM